MGPLDFTRCALLMINKTKEDVLCNEGGLSICLLSLLKNFMRDKPVNNTLESGVNVPLTISDICSTDWQKKDSAFLSSIASI